MSATDPAAPDPALLGRLAQLLDSYARFTGESLGSPEALVEAPFVVLAHGIEQPPVLWYGNRRALALWKMSFAEFTCMPSHRTAEADLRQVREQLLRDVRQHGVSRDYTGVRVASDGTRFAIERATVWNILDSREQLVGQAATFASARPL